MDAKFILEDGRIEYKGEYDFKSNNYIGKILMTSRCNIPRKVVSDCIVDGVRILCLTDKI